jgi:succinate-semialdehyde dehydrogenase/glutarate-semialdehyde dehydrogenase
VVELEHVVRVVLGLDRAEPLVVLVAEGGADALLALVAGEVQVDARGGVRRRRIADAIARANASDYGLNCSIWTRDAGRGHAIATRIQAGTVNVNEGYSAARGSVDAPMGGMKSSGLGRRHGAEGIRKYTDQQTVAVQRMLPIAPSHGLSQKLWGRVMTASLRLLRRLPGVR